jgi:hypothetical protein
MNDETTTLDQADEEILTYTASDEALEAAAGTEVYHFTISFAQGLCCFVG